VTVGVPCVIGANGIERVIELDLDDKTKAKFAKSVESIRENIDILTDSGFFN